jgi:hypothetical protein
MREWAKVNNIKLIEKSLYKGLKVFQVNKDKKK